MRNSEKIQTDEALMKLFQVDRDETAFNQIVQKYYNPALALATVRLRCSETAKDVVQETFIRVMHKCNSYDCSRPFAPWFYSVLRNICFDAMRTNMRDIQKHNAFFNESEMVASPAYPDFALDVLSKLPEQEREIMVLRFVHGMSMQEIADTCDCSVETAKKRAQRSLARLKEIVKKVVPESIAERVV